jgi:uncharacterized membrane protein YdfJ with MMPL/SSD domain
VLDFPSFAPTLGIMLGLGAGIDYALLIVGALSRAAGERTTAFARPGADRRISVSHSRR